jgi:hypothetical protein
MNLQKKFRYGFLVILAGLIVWALPLSAQQLYKGTFDLPFTAHWNGAVLEPGKYTVTVEQGLATRLIRVQGEGRTVVAVANPSQVETSTENGRIIFAQVGGNYAIEELIAGSLGQSYTFALPKSLRPESARSAKALDTVVLSTH